MNEYNEQRRAMANEQMLDFLRKRLKNGEVIRAGTLEGTRILEYDEQENLCFIGVSHTKD